MDKKASRIRRAGRARGRIERNQDTRLSIHKSANHTYAQIVVPGGAKVIVSASTLDKELRDQIKHGGNKASAELVGKLIAKRALAAGVKKVAFDRGGYKYHGCVKALADAARGAGLDF